MTHEEATRLIRATESIVEVMVEKYGVPIEDAWDLLIQYAADRKGEDNDLRTRRTR